MAETNGAPAEGQEFLAQVKRLVQQVQQVRQRGRLLLLFLDYDGTLVDIAPRPELARPTPDLLELLGRLTNRRDLRVLVVSGRPLAELKELLPVPGLDVLGSHGGEALLNGRLVRLTSPATDSGETQRRQEELTASLAPFSGWWLEPKPGGFAVHYREVPQGELPAFLARLAAWEKNVRAAGRVQLLAGRKVREVLPLGVSKGAAIQKILSLPGFRGRFPIYLGDDFTDESAFEVLRDRGLIIKVGGSGTETAAPHRLPHPQAVRSFLGHLAQLPEEF